MTRQRIEEFFREEPRLRDLLDLCRTELCAEEVWLFGSRARGDHHGHSDWDLLVIVRDDAPEEVLDPVLLWKTRRRSGVHCDLLAVKKADFEGAKDVTNTLSHAVKREGVRLDG